MKLKYIFATLVATLALAVGCEKEADHYLKEVQVSSSYLAFPAEGGSVDVVVTATQDWSINTIPEWIIATPAYGSVGETQVRFTVLAATETREAEFTITSGTVGQTMIASQVTEAVEPEIVNVAGALALIKAVDKGDGGSYNVSGTYRVKGIVCKISDISVSYGNATYYLSDDGKFNAETALQVYRGLWLEGGAFTKGDEFAVGDELTIEGQLMSYKGTPETVEKTAFVVAINKSLIGVEGTELMNVEEGMGVTEYPVEGGSIKVYIMTKGNGFHVNIPAETKSWLHIEDFGTDYVTLSADANEGGDRNVTVGFTTESGNQTYSCELALSQKGAIKNVTVAEFLAAAEGSSVYRLNGLITGLYASDSQGKSFYIQDYSGSVLVYRAEGFETSGAKVGDIVTVCGKRTSYKETPQMGSATFEAIDKVVTAVKVADFLAAAESKDVWYMISGTVEKPTEKETKWDIETYGNLNLRDETGSVYVYGVSTGINGESKKFSTLGVKEGDKMTIIGYRTSFKGLNQVGGGMYVSHEAGGGQGGGGDDTSKGKYVAVSSTQTDWAGKYLIVWGNGAHGTASSKDLAKTVDVAITDGAIAASEEINAAAVTVAAMEGGYSISLSDGKFLTFTTNGNQCTFADAAAPMNFGYTDTGIKVYGMDTADNTRYLMMNATGSTLYFRGYKETSFIKEGSWVQGYSYPQLYKFVAQ